MFRPATPISRDHGGTWPSNRESPLQRACRSSLNDTANTKEFSAFVTQAESNEKDQSERDFGTVRKSSVLYVSLFFVPRAGGRGACWRKPESRRRPPLNRPDPGQAVRVNGFPLRALVTEQTHRLLKPVRECSLQHANDAFRSLAVPLFRVSQRLLAYAKRLVEGR